MKKISICTVCMNRLSHLQRTLPVNIEENKDYPNLEFVLLDYNSRDGLETWIQSAMMKHIESGVLKYYKTYEPEDFKMAHSKNMACLLASGEFIALVDADNYAGRNYVEWLNSVVNKHGNNAIATTHRKTQVPFRDQGGKLGFNGDFFKSVQGFDESLVGYGMEDVDLVNRLEKAGGSRIFIDDPEFLRYIGHSHEERLKNHYLNRNLESLYWLKSDSSDVENRVLYLLTNKTFIHAEYVYCETMEENMVLSYGGWMLKEDAHLKGEYERKDGCLTLKYNNGASMIYKEDADGNLDHVTDRDLFWQNVRRHDEMFIELIMGYGECLNRVTFSENQRDFFRTNTDGYGKGVVYFNFDRTKPLRVGRTTVSI